MTIEHKDITDPDLHEPKGAAAASAGTVLSADGLGGTAWVSPSTLENIEIGPYINNQYSADLNPSAVDTPLLVPFDSTVADANLSMDASGVITVLTAGIYNCTFTMNFGRSSSTGVAILLARLLVNDVQSGRTLITRIDASTDINMVQANLELNLAVNDTLKVQIMRDSSGVNNGGLRSLNVALAGWNEVPSYWARFRRLAGFVEA